MHYLQVEVQNAVMTIHLNRPEVHNAFDELLIDEIKNCFLSVANRADVRVVVLRGHGKSFCAGADLNWMRKVSGYTYQQNLEESSNLSDCFHAIYTCPKPTIALVHGAAMGGANGLLASCDMAIADSSTVFSLSEVKIGLIPACISPYIIKKVGEGKARELMLTGLRFGGDFAEKIGLINYSLSTDMLQTKLNELIDLLLNAGPKSIENCKILIDNVVNHQTLEESKIYTAQMIAQQRISAEGQEGMAAFLEKRKPNWAG
ncbi:MAG: enoyl-CoA hydratase/isomerase family protein [Cytophagales bacterium]